MKIANSTNCTPPTGRKAPQWFSYVNTILATIGTGSFTPLQDKITYQVMAKVVPGLMSKGGIDGTLLDALVTNIRARAGERQFTAKGPVILTRDQKQYARNKGWNILPTLEELRERNGDAMQGRNESGIKAELERKESGMIADDVDLIDAITLFIRTHYARDPQSFRSLSAFLPRKAAEKLESWVLNEMKWNEKNHEIPMISADAVNDLASPETHESAGLQEGAYRDVGGSYRQSDTHRDDHGPAAVAAKPARTKPVVVSFFQADPDAQPTANVEIGDDRYTLQFTTVDAFEQRIHGAASPAWYTSYDAEIGSEYRDYCRTLEQRGSVARFMVSSFNAYGDVRGYKPVAVGDALAIIGWNEAREPERVVLKINDKMTSVELQSVMSKKAKSPTHKGFGQLAA
jgi:hypothetical protein